MIQSSLAIDQVPLVGKDTPGLMVPALLYSSGIRIIGGEIVNIYDCIFNDNTGSNLFSMDSTSGILFNIYCGDFTGNTFTGNSALMLISAFNIYGGNFTGNTAQDPYNGIHPSILHVGGDRAATERAPVSINGGIINGGDDFYSINLNKDDNHERISFNGGSMDSLVWSAGLNTPVEYALSEKHLVLASALLHDSRQVEYVTYGADGAVNINSPLKIDSTGNVVYKFDKGYSSITGAAFNGPDFNPAITEFGVFLPADQIELIESITVHFADDTSVTLNKTTDGNTVKFS